MLDTLLVHPILNILALFYKLTSNLGWSIIILTIFIKLVLIPFVVPTYKNMKKQKDIKPQLDKLKEKYKTDKQKFAEEQMKLFKEHGINPASGCLSQVVMIFVLIGLYQVVQNFSTAQLLSDLNSNFYFDFLKFSEGLKTNTMFWFLDMSKPDATYILPLVTGIATLISSAMMLPELTEAEKAAKKASSDLEDMAYSMQQQMTIIAPVMTFMVALSLPSALTLYIFVSSLFGVFQQYFMLGSWGGLIQYINLAKKKLNR
jgi:YidC/Oxa1 family membrane protein insertase